MFGTPAIFDRVVLFSVLVVVAYFPAKLVWVCVREFWLGLCEAGYPPQMLTTVIARPINRGELKLGESWSLLRPRVCGPARMR